MNLIKTIKPWTAALLILVVIDAIVTTYIGVEKNPLILWTMDTFDLTLKGAMIAKVIYSIPLIAYLNYVDFSRLTFLAYIGLYLIFTGVQLF